MIRRDLALAYIRAFCAGDLPALQSLLAEDLRFSGPFHQFDSRAAYLESLTADPPDNCGYLVLGVAESDDAVAVFWEYAKPGRPLTIAQWFRVRADRISEILVVFDARNLGQLPVHR